LIRIEALNEARVIDVAQRLRANPPWDERIEADVTAILRGVKSKGDEAIIDYTRKLNGVSLRKEELRVSEQEIESAYATAPKQLIAAIRNMKRRLERVQRSILRKLCSSSVRLPGVRIKTIFKPIESVGCYIPGGKATYPSSLVMTVTPAKIAGVKRIVVCSPPSEDKRVNIALLAAAKICDVNEFYRVGGPHAIAALAYGTETIRRVDKIVGPGGPYVTLAKLAVSRQTMIDMCAGPTELVIVADRKANVKHIARDLIAQAEHGPDSVCGLITTSTRLASEVSREIAKILKGIRRRTYVEKALKDFGFIYVVPSEEVAVKFVDAFAPEHLEILTQDAKRLAMRINSSGLILIGTYSPASASDYCLGSNHVIPTLGFARARSALSVLDFVKQINMVSCSKRGLEVATPVVEVLASVEGLPNHALAVTERFKPTNQIESSTARY
jgi:histidinol dehydrogenase